MTFFKKIFFLLFFWIFWDFSWIFALSPVFFGIWEGKDRFLVFQSENSQIESEKNEQNPLTIILKTFYSLYFDRASEPKSAQNFLREKNAALSAIPEEQFFFVETLFEDEKKSSGAYRLKLFDGKTEKSIPLAIIEGKMFLNFLLRSDFNENQNEFSQSFMDGFWKSAGIAEIPKIYGTNNAKEIFSYYFNQNDVYKIRYWLCDVENADESEKAYFSDGEKQFFVDKYIKNGNLLYTCATGKRKSIRNVEKLVANALNFTLDESKNICALERESFLLIQKEFSQETFYAMILKNNAKQKAPPPSPFKTPLPAFRFKELSDKDIENPFILNRRNLDLHK